MHRFRHTFTLLACLLPFLTACGELTIEVRGSADAGGKRSVSLRGVQTDASPEAESFLRILRNDLALSGWLRPVESDEAALSLRGSVCRGENLSYNVTAWQAGGAQARAWRHTVPAGDVRAAAHALSDAIVREMLGRAPMASSKILFVGKQGTAWDVFCCDADGANVRRVTNERALCTSPTWEPGRPAFLYTSYRTGKPIVYEVDLATNERRLLSARPGMNQGAVMSPAGDRICLVMSATGAVELYLMDPELRKVTDRLTHTKDGNEASPSWSPDGRSIVYVSDEGGVPRCYKMDVATRRVSRLVFSPEIGENVAPEWGPDGRIAFCGRSAGRYGIFTVGADSTYTTVPVRIDPADGADYEDPSWAPDGRHLVCTRTAGAIRTLVVLDTAPPAERDVPRELLPFRGDAYLASWSDNL